MKSEKYGEKKNLFFQFVLWILDILRLKINLPEKKVVCNLWIVAFCLRNVIFVIKFWGFSFVYSDFQP